MNSLTTIRNLVAVFACSLAALVSTNSASGQPREHRLENTLAAAGGEKDAREMVEMVMMVRLSRELELLEEETVLLVRRMSDFREEFKRMNRQRHRLMVELRSVVQDGDGTEEEILAKLEELKELDRRLNNAKLDLHERLSEGLDAGQQARLYVFLQEFEENMRRMVQRVRERSRAMKQGRGGPPPQRMMRDRLPRDTPERRDRNAGSTPTHGGQEVDRPDADRGPVRDDKPHPN